MIQRVQNLYLLAITALISIILITNPVISLGNGIKEGTSTIYRLSILKKSFYGHTTTESLNYGILAIILCCGILSVSTITLFKNLKLQRTFTLLNFMVVGLIFTLIFTTHYDVIQSFDLVSESQFTLFNLYFPLILFLNLMAYKGIMKDLHLLASADRLR